jgi:hypothetical protein
MDYRVCNVPLVHVNVGLLAANIGVTATDTLDGCQRVHNLVLAVNVGVEHTQNVLEMLLIGNDERLHNVNG